MEGNLIPRYDINKLIDSAHSNTDGEECGNHSCISSHLFQT